MSLSQALSLLPLVFIGSAALISLRAFIYSFSAPLKVFSMVWIIVFTIEIAGHLMSGSNHWLYNIFYPFLYLSLTYIYQQVLQSAFIQKLIQIFYISFVVFVVINSFLIQGITTLQTLTIAVGGSFITFLAGAYFRQLYKSEDSEKITKDPFFWFSFGFILYFGGTVPFLAMLNYLWQLSEEFTKFYFLYFSNAFSIFLNILISIGFLCRKNYLKSSLYL